MPAAGPTIRVRQRSERAYSILGIAICCDSNQRWDDTVAIAFQQKSVFLGTMLPLPEAFPFLLAKQ
jgi:hypothetical protein